MQVTSFGLCTFTGPSKVILVNSMETLLRVWKLMVSGGMLRQMWNKHKKLLPS